MLAITASLLLFIVNLVAGATLYGVYTLPAGNDFVTYTGIIDTTTGNATNLVENVVFFDSKVSVIGGNSAFDNKNKIFYYYDNSASDFVYAIDVVNKKIAKLYSSNANEIVGLAYDSSSGYLVISGLYGSSSTELSDVIVFMPTTNDELESGFLNFTDVFKGGNQFAGGAVDSKNGIFYSVFGVGGTQLLAIIDIAARTGKSVPLPCNNYLAFDLTYDEVNTRLISVGVHGEQWAYIEIDTKSFSCSATPLNITLEIISTYDPTTQTIYMITDDGLLIYDIQKKLLSDVIALDVGIDAIAVAY
jgi:hypothetical protein